MPSFSGFPKMTSAKPDVWVDGEQFTTTDGYTITSTLGSYTAFLSQPVTTGSGTWSVELKDNWPLVIFWSVHPILLTAANYSIKLLPTSLSAAGNVVLNWQVQLAASNSALPAGAGFEVLVVLQNSSAGIAVNDQLP